MPNARFSHRATTPAAPTQVWKRLQDPTTWAAVAGVDHTSDHEFAGDSLVRFRFTTSISGVTYRGRARVTASEPETSMSLAIESSEIAGDILVALAPAATGSDLEVVMTMRPAGLVGTLVFPLVSGAVSSGFGDSVDRLAARMV
ncbi:hypothetical protein BH23ACT5_BH23ACT5_07640 [soil metagenome]